MDENAPPRHGDEPEYELADTGVFDEDRYFDVVVEYAKAAPEDIVIRITVTNRGPEPAPLHLLPTLWFRNTWAWGLDDRRPELARATDGAGDRADARHRHHALGDLLADRGRRPELPLFTENETNAERLWGAPNRDALRQGRLPRRRRPRRPRAGWPNPAGNGDEGRRALPRLVAGAGRDATCTSAARDARPAARSPVAFEDATTVAARRAGGRRLLRRGLAVGRPTDDRASSSGRRSPGCSGASSSTTTTSAEWLDGDPPARRRRPTRRRPQRRLAHTQQRDVISMPDKWEYPWFAAWDLAFHCVPLALIDPEFAKAQLVLLTREWYMHPNGQLPAYEWAFGDVNPPVHAWAAWRVYKIDAASPAWPTASSSSASSTSCCSTSPGGSTARTATGTTSSRAASSGSTTSASSTAARRCPTGGHLEQADGTAWMGFYSLQMMQIALELARENPVYEDVATKFFEHFLYIAGALNDIGGTGISLWDDEDGFFYDVLHLPDDSKIQLKVRSLVGLIPLLAVETIEPEVLERLPGFARRLGWFLKNRPDLASSSRAGTSRAWASGGCWRWCAATG